MKTGKTTHYLKYAIGEIALVMIGILLALQVSNWNEKRIIQQNEIKILSQLNEDLKTNLVELTGIHSYLKLCNSDGLKMLNHIETKSTVTDSLKFWTEGFVGGNIFNNANTTYKNLENSEKNIISNDSLRLRITLMYELEFVNVHQREKFFYESYLPTYNKEFYKNFKVSATKHSWLQDQTLNINTPRNIKALKNNEDFKNAFVEMYNSRLVRLQWLGQTLPRLKKLIDDINLEIKNIQ